MLIRHYGEFSIKNLELFVCIIIGLHAEITIQNIDFSNKKGNAKRTSYNSIASAKISNYPTLPPLVNSTLLGGSIVM